MSDVVAYNPNKQFLIKTEEDLLQLLPDDKRALTLNERMKKFYSARQDYKKHPPTFNKFCSDYNQFVGMLVANQAGESYYAALTILESLETELASIEPHDKERANELQSLLINYESKVQGRFKSWHKVWESVRSFEEKTLDRETPTNINVNTTHSFNPQQIGMFLSKNRNELERVNKTIDMERE
jgi:hypothetical protein